MSGELISVSETSKHKQEAYDFMRWISTEGIVKQGVWVPSLKDADLNKVLETLGSEISNPDAIHIESFKHALTSVQSTNRFAPKGLITEEFNRYKPNYIAFKFQAFPNG